MKTFLPALLALVMMASPVLALDSDLESASRGIFTSLLRIILKWIFPVGAAYCFLHGVIGKGVKRGEWDMAAICTVAAIGLALFPRMLAALFQVNLAEVLG